MKIPSLIRYAIIVFGALSIIALKPVHAADAPAPIPSITKKEVNPAPPKLSEQDLDKVLKTLVDYAAMLKKAGYSTNIATKSANEQVLSINWQDRTGKYGVNLTQNKNGQEESLTFVAPLSSFANHPKVPAEVFFKLVEAQDATHGWYFVFNPQLRELFLCRTIPNTQITTRQLLFELKSLQFAADLTARVWNPNEWITKPQPSTTTPAPAPAKTPTTATPQ